MTLSAVALALVTAAPFASAARDGLAVRLSVPAPVLRGDVDVMVDVSVTNTSRVPVSVLRWELPIASAVPSSAARVDNAHFRITRDGEPVAYTGPLVKRAAPTAADYVRIEPGATLTYSVELTGVYDLSRSGSYAIAYAGKGTREADASALQSQPLYLWLESRSGRAAVPATSAPVVARTQAGSPPAQPDVSISFTGNCSVSRQSMLTDAVAAATTYANQSVNYFASTRSVTSRFAKWFGAAPDRTQFSTGRTHYAAIQDAFVNKPLTLDCSCTDSYYAYVYANQPYKIYVCNAFWSAPMTGTDSKAGTLIHEMSHFTVVAGTQDWAYGQSAAAALAISNPTNAMNNADSHEYFAENTPALP